MNPSNKLALSDDVIAQIMTIARHAGTLILEIYNAFDATDIDTKCDGSPVTAADLAAHYYIVDALTALLPLPIISEEAGVADFSVRRLWQQYWLVDPLDGTKEFIARNGEFTVNIALIENSCPLLGVIHAPVADETYVGVDKSVMASGKTVAEKYRGRHKIQDLRSRSLTSRFDAKETLAILISHRHGVVANQTLLKTLEQNWPATLQYQSVGSSLKFCWLAEGRADLYPRYAPTYEWDTAAAQAILVAAGGCVIDVTTLLPLQYNRKESLLNSYFLALGDRTSVWCNLKLL